MNRSLCALLIAALALAAMPAIAQYSVLSPQDQARLDALSRQQAEQDARTQAELRAAKAKLLRSAALPDARNPLLGRWRVEGAGRARSEKEQLSQLLFDTEAFMGGSMCQMVFGGGITEFKPKSWSSIDSTGDDTLGPIHYRGDSKLVWAVPESKMFHFFGFQFVSPNRITLVGFDGCNLVRVGAPAGAAAAVPNGRAATAAPPQVAGLAPAPERSRPSDEVCRQTLLDKLGTAGVNRVRELTGLRFKETLEGKVPNTQNLRIDARGSACDDPRINAVLYDFDVNGMLQSITLVWARAAGPAPAPIFQERVATLSRLHSLPPPQSPGRLQADTSLGRLVLQDMPERNLLLEAYVARR